MNQQYCNGMIHVIKPGDTLYQLSRRYRVPLALILRANPYVDVYNLQPGQEVCIPVARPYPVMRPPFAPKPPGRPRPQPRVFPEETDENGELAAEHDKSAVQDAPMPDEGTWDREADGDVKEEVSASADEAVGGIDGTTGDMDGTTGKDNNIEATEASTIADGKMSLAELLERWNMSLSEFLEKNPPESFGISEGTKLILR